MKAKNSWKSMNKYGANLLDFIRSTNIKSNDYDEQYIKIKLNLDDDLLLKKTLELQAI